MICPSCGNPNEAGRKFCGECGSALAQACPSCGTPNTPGVKFCGECGAALSEQPGTAAPIDQSAPAAERRLVSVLFADLVGFTGASEERDAEDTRELLSRYFDTARTVIERYGGTVEKFIGDAVMAVWGAPVAQEDDAERAVRAALDLVDAVAALGEEVGFPGLRLRAGVLTGEAAVTVGAEGQGMVAGDLVNTASRIQGVAEPGNVVVGESTRRASEAAIAYDDAGEHDLKGKTDRVRLWRALRVTAGRKGTLKAAGLEPPFVGRERELRLVKDLFHTSAEEQRAQLVTVTGIAGIGKSRLSWEFEKYVDGLAEDVFWHRGRCLSYGEGVAYWALAEMVRMRCGIVEDEDALAAREKLRLAVEEHISDPPERQWVEPRLAHLLGLQEGAPGDEENLFSAWRILFERLAQESPTVLVFEDLQWADAGLLDFLEYLLEWSRGYPLFVITLARPEFADKRPTWGAGKRNFTQLYLEPLSPDAMDRLLAGLVPGLPGDLRERILERAEGVPLYAVETVRMLLDRELLVREGNVYRPTGPVESLDVPETLHALVAARLDGLTGDERRLVQDGAVLGRTFTKQGLAALTGVPEPELESLLAALLRKEILSVQADPRSPERGQYAFLQDVVKRVAYETLSKKERKAKHLAAALFLAPAPSAEEDEIAEVVASHYLDAYEAAPDAPDAAEIKGRAREMLVRAGERAASLAANAEAQRSFERAASLTEHALVQAELLERAGMMASVGARADEAAAHFEHAIASFEAEGATHAGARVAAKLAEILWERGRLEEAVARMDRSFVALSEEEPDADLAWLAAQLGRCLLFAGDRELAAQRIESALDIAETLSLPEVLSQALNTKALLLDIRGRRDEALVLLRHSLEVALEHDKPSAALRAYYNLADGMCSRDRYEESSAALRDGLALARRAGNRWWEWALLGWGYTSFALGDWNAVLASSALLPPSKDWTEARLAFGPALNGVLPVHVHRGQLDEARHDIAPLGDLAASADVQERAYYGAGSARLLLAESKAGDALHVAAAAVELRAELGIAHDAVKESFVAFLEAALETGDVEEAERLLAIVESLPSGRQTRFLRAHTLRFRARLLEGKADAAAIEGRFDGATELFRAIGLPFYLAVTLLEYGEWLTGEGRSDQAEPLLTEARTIFERLEAAPWLERASRVAATAEVHA